MVFWPERSAARVSSAFHAALFQARSAVGCSFVIFEQDLYRWNPGVSYWCDVIEFERLCDQAERLPAGNQQAVPLLEQAVALYGGDFLAEFDWEWCLLRREELSQRFLWALLRLGELYLEVRDLARAREAYQKACRVDSYAEEAYRGLMRCHWLAGERAAAIRVYQQCREHLRQELGVDPAAETEALYQAIRRGSPA